MDVVIHRSTAFPLDTPVNSYYIPKYSLVIDAGIEWPGVPASHVYVTHWHWDHVLGLSGAPGNTVVCISNSTIRIIETRSYEERVRAVLQAAGVRLSPLEERFLEVMRERYELIRDALQRLDTMSLEECPHIRSGELKFYECPGHSIDHVCFQAGDAVFVGDTLLPGTRTTVIDFLAHRKSVTRILSLPWSILYPGHGSPLERSEILETATDYLVRRCGRAYRIISAVHSGARDVASLLRIVYGVEPGLQSFVAIRTLIGYLSELEEEGVLRIHREYSPWRVEPTSSSG